MILTIFVAVFRQINCVPVDFRETKTKRAVFDLIPSSETMQEVDSPGSPCKCDNWAFLCIRDEHLVCRRTLTELVSIAGDEKAQVVDRMERRRRRKNRRHLRRLFRKWLKEEIQ